VELNPNILPAHILKIKKNLRKKLTLIISSKEEAS
jgi:hypothetical protein